MNSMLEFKTLAAEARASGLDKDPVVQARIAAQLDRTLAAIRSEQIEREAGAAFERRRDDFVGRARELYLLEKDKYTQPPKVRASHILIRTGKRTKDEALRLATEVRARAVAPNADFAALALEYSEDLTVKTNGGDVGWFDTKQVDRAFSKAAFALAKQGDISEPVLSCIRLPHHPARRAQACRAAAVRCRQGPAHDRHQGASTSRRPRPPCSTASSAIRRCS